jgi:putative acetyltransferase
MIIRQECKKDFEKIYQLVKKAFQTAKEKGYISVVLVGDPDYYHRFGFKSSIEFNIKHALDIPEQFVMANELVPNAFQGISGLMHG